MELSQAGAAERLSQRVVSAGLAGAIIPFLHFGWMLLVLALTGTGTSRCGLLGCLGQIADAWESGRWASLVLAWPLLYLLRVRSAWPVALAAPFFLVPLWELADGLVGPAVVMTGVFAYPFAALVTAPRISWRWRGLILGLFLVLCAVLAFVPGWALNSGYS
ncbi:hypothetical protein ACTMTI_18995 [Nonomuraea sp. H19]|uniref:hypothetical protein n=1 Tax=Nonomuraea sp. H19 TaxID=3452206 RepID=UPI003F88B666